jgi:hypothetical protein
MNGLKYIQLNEIRMEIEIWQWPNFFYFGQRWSIEHTRKTRGFWFHCLLAWHYGLADRSYCVRIPLVALEIHAIHLINLIIPQ